MSLTLLGSGVADQKMNIAVHENASSYALKRGRDPDRM